MRNEKTVTLPINQNKQRHQSSLRKSRTNESHQISSKFLPQLGFISMFDSSSRLLSRGSGASPSAAKVVGEQVVVHSRKCFAAWNWSADDYLVQQPTRLEDSEYSDSANWLAVFASNALKTRGQTFLPFFSFLFRSKGKYVSDGDVKTTVLMEQNAGEKHVTHVMKCKYSPWTNQSRLTISSPYNVVLDFDTFLC